MTGDTLEQAQTDHRRRRINRIKKIITTLVVVLLILPTVLSVFLIVKVVSLQRQIDDIVLTSKEERALDSESVQAREKEAGPVADTEEPEETAEPETDRKKVYLTFDDGPGTETARILDVLKDKKIKATFFVTGKEDAYSKKMYRRIVDEGHTLGMHSYSHIYSQIYKSRESFQKDLERLIKMLKKVTNTTPEYYRFPGGSNNQNTNISMQNFVEVLAEKNISYVDWNVISPDVKVTGATRKEMVEGILEDVAKYDTSIVMMYDAADRPNTAKALPEIIDSLKEENYELLPVGEDTVPIRHDQKS